MCWLCCVIVFKNLSDVKIHACVLRLCTIDYDYGMSRLFNTCSIPLFDLFGDLESTSGTLYDCTFYLC